jgi:hypothetical protein
MMKQISHFYKQAFVFITLSVFVTTITLVSSGYRKKLIADEVWKQLGISQADANRNIINSSFYGHLQYYGAKNAKNITGQERIAVVKELAAYAKQYCNSSDFKDQYQKFRERKKPQPPIDMRVSADEIRAQEKKRLEDGIKLMEANANSPNEKLRNSVPARIAAMQKELSELNNPDNRVIKARVDNANRSYEYGLKAHKDALAKLETQYPENPQLLIKKRLEELLAATSDIDYSAELKEQYGKKVFVNPAYQAKSEDWKLAYRAGKETTDVVRAIAQQWLQQIK